MSTEEIKSVNDLNNIFVRMSRELEPYFRRVEGYESFWKDLVTFGGDFPVAAGFAARISLAKRHEVGPPQGNQHWYRLLQSTYNAPPVCLEALWADALNLPDELERFFTHLKLKTSDFVDDFCRTSHASISANRLLEDTKIRVGEWDFTQDKNGVRDINQIIFNCEVNPNEILSLSKTQVHRVYESGFYDMSFPEGEEVRLITDRDTFKKLPYWDTQRRNLEGRGVEGTSLSMILQEDKFPLRYNWDDDQKILVRVPHSDEEKYQNADFQISIPFSHQPVFTLQFGGPRPVTPENWFYQFWVWVNDCNEVTPCNVDRNKGFFRFISKLAARPKNGGQSGNLILHRRYPTEFQAVCRPWR